MHFGIFLEESRHGTSQATALREMLELAEAAEACGLDGVWLGEIHFNPARSVLAAPIAVASFIAARTRRLRVGTAVQVLPLGNPLRIAEEVATLDHLSEGRFDFGIGRSGAARTYDVLGIPYGESQARFLEALEIIRKAWTEDTFSYEGEFYRFQNATVVPRPYQRPYPPIRMAANTPETFSVVGRLGLGIFVGTRDLDVPELRIHLTSYRQGWRDAGHPGEADVPPDGAGATESPHPGPGGDARLPVSAGHAPPEVDPRRLRVARVAITRCRPRRAVAWRSTPRGSARNRPQPPCGTRPSSPPRRRTCGAVPPRAAALRGGALCPGIGGSR
jgi:hypothetical protein